MTPGPQKRRGNPDAFGSIPAAAPRRRVAPEVRYRLLLTRMPSAWELIVFDRDRACVMRRMSGPVVEALLRTGALPGELAREGACYTDKSLVLHLFLAGAALSSNLEDNPESQQQARRRAAASSSRVSPYEGAVARDRNDSQGTPSGSSVHSLSERA